MQWTCQLFVKTGTSPEVDGPSSAGRKFVSGDGEFSPIRGGRIKSSELELMDKSSQVKSSPLINECDKRTILQGKHNTI